MGARSPSAEPEFIDSGWDMDVELALLPLDPLTADSSSHERGSVSSNMADEPDEAADEPDEAADEPNVADARYPLADHPNIVVAVSIPPPALPVRAEETRTIVISEPPARFDDPTLVLEKRTLRCVAPPFEVSAPQAGVASLDLRAGPTGPPRRHLSESVTLRPSELSVYSEPMPAFRSRRWRLLGWFAVAAPLSFAIGAGLARLQSSAVQPYQLIVARATQENSQASKPTEAAATLAAAPALQAPRTEAVREGAVGVPAQADLAEAIPSVAAQPTPESGANVRPVRIRVVPIEASLWEGGRRLGVGRVALEVARGERRELTATLAGHRPRMISVDGSHDRVVIILDPVDPSGAPRDPGVASKRKASSASKSKQAIDPGLTAASGVDAGTRGRLESKLPLSSKQPPNDPADMQLK